jgi:transposase InsO family protein
MIFRMPIDQLSEQILDLKALIARFRQAQRGEVASSAWRQEYNQVRPHSALGQATPAEFARQEVVLRKLLEPQAAVP